MAIIVPIVHPESWRQLLDSGDELGKLLSDRLRVDFTGSDPSIEASVRAHLATLCPTEYGACGGPTTRPEPRTVEQPDEDRDIMVLSANTRKCRQIAGRETAEHRRNEAILLVPELGESDTRLYLDRLIVLMPESGKFDTIQSWVHHIARYAHCQIALLTVLTPDAGRTGDLGAQFTGANQQLKQRADELRALGARATWEVRMGEPAEEISRLAETTGTNLIVMLEPQDDQGEQRLLDALLSRSNLYLLLVT